MGGAASTQQGTSSAPDVPPGEPGGHEEIEWQFDAIDLRPVERWLEGYAGTDGADGPGPAGPGSPVLRRQPGRRLVDTYGDTEDWRIFRAGYALRIRSGARRIEATLKSLAPPSEGLRRRREITERLSDGDLASLVAGDGPVGTRVRALAGRRSIRPILQVRTRRRPYVVEHDGRPAAEIVLDETTIVIGDGQPPARLRRVEVEVPEGTETLTAFVRLMRERCGLQEASLSKFEVGLLASGSQPPAGPDLGPTRIDASRSIGEVAFAVLRRQFAAFLAKEAGTRLGEDPEELHDMRVAARRLRAALSLFAHVLPVRAARLRGELGWVAQALGAVRDVDVQLDQLQAWTGEAGGPDREALGSLIAILQEQREEARSALLGTLDSRRYDRLTIAFVAMLRHGPLRTSPASRAPALAAAPELLTKRYRRVRAAARRVARAGGVEDLHRLRIRCKRLRYALEFFEEVYDHRGRSVIRRLVTLQDLLGGIQDSNVAIARLRELSTAGGASLSPATVFAMGQVAQRYAHRAEALRDRYPKRYRRFRGRRWRAFARMLKEGGG